MALIILAVLFFGFVDLTLAAQCLPDPTNPCKARCNGTTFDISNLFDYPVKLSDSRGYSYMWSPCTGYPQCNNSMNDPDCAICQHADQYYNCGRTKDPIYLFNYHFDTFVYQIQYLWGIDWRMTVFTFLQDKTQEETTIEFTGEDPYLQYNFLVRGKCVGQMVYDHSCDKH